MWQALAELSPSCEESMAATVDAIDAEWEKGKAAQSALKLQFGQNTSVGTPMGDAVRGRNGPVSSICPVCLSRACLGKSSLFTYLRRKIEGKQGCCLKTGLPVHAGRLCGEPSSVRCDFSGSFAGQLNTTMCFVAWGWLYDNHDLLVGIHEFIEQGTRHGSATR